MADDLDLTRLGAVLRRARGDRTLREIAESGALAVSHLSRVENGPGRDLPVRTLVRLARAYGVSPFVLLDVVGDFSADDVAAVVSVDSRRMRDVGTLTGLSATVAVDAKVPDELLAKLEAVGERLTAFEQKISTDVFTMVEMVQDLKHQQNASGSLPAVLKGTREVV